MGLLLWKVALEGLLKAYQEMKLDEMFAGPRKMTLGSTHCPFER